MIRNAPVLLCTLLLFATAPTQGSDSVGASVGSNVLVTITVTEGSGSPEKSYQFIARDRTGAAELLTGWRVPVPTAESGSPAVTSYTYQNVGLTARIKAQVLPDSHVALRGGIEISKVSEPTTKPRSSVTPPIIGTFQQEFDVVLREGDPLDLAVVSTPDGGELTVRLRADCLN